MDNYSDKTIKIAILDMYEGVPNQGMRGLREIINQFGDYNNLDIQRDEFDIRLKEELPDLSYDIYISSGGPGSPLESEGSSWENKFFAWIQSVLDFNAKADPAERKNVFFICHSFQLACRFFKLAEVSKRNSTSFGIFPVHFVGPAIHEPIFDGLKDPFYVVDSRDYQVTKPNITRIKELGAQLLLIEKARPHVAFERAIMSIRFNENIFGTQFHPEADPVGMSIHLQTPERKKVVVDNYGLEKWESMIEQLNDPDKIVNTYKNVVPNFLRIAVNQVLPQPVD